MDQGLRYVQLARAVSFEVDNATPAGTDNLRGHGYFNIEQEYFNGLSKPVTVVDRNGMQVTIPPGFNPAHRDFVIRLKVTFGRDVKVNIDRLLSGTSVSAKALAETIQEGSVQFRHGERRHSMDYHITLEDIESRGGSIYLSNLDRVVSTLHGHLIPLHPHSEAAIRNRLVEEDPTVNEVDSFGYSLRIVDSQGLYGDRYVNINNQVYKVPISRSAAMPDGVYLTSSGPVTGDYNLVKPISKRYGFEEADVELRLYRTAEEARTLGDVLSEKEKELKQLAVEIKEREQRLKEEKLSREHEFELLKQRLDQERAEEDAQRKREETRLQQRQLRLKEEISELEHRRNMENLRQKDYYENRSLERKDSSEVVKFLPSLVMGAVALFAVFSKLSG